MAGPASGIELRFKVGDRVQCRVGPTNDETSWAAGTIVKLWYREDRWPKSKFAPYQVKLDDNRLIFAPMDDDRVVRSCDGILAKGKIPVTILTGFLGSGKTTLLNYILKARHGMKYAIIENEVGAVGVDNLLLKKAGGERAFTEESVVLLDNGCLCCTVRGDLVNAIKGIVDAARKKGEALKEANPESEESVLDGIIIETTGIADPGPICKTFYGDTYCSVYCKIDGVITMVDTVHFIDQLTRERSEGAVNESAQQVAFADKVLLNKTDAASAEKVAQVMEAVRSVNSFVPMMKCSVGKNPEAVPLEQLLSIDMFDPEKAKTDVDLSVCGAVIEAAAESSGHGDGHGDGHGEGHGGGHGECPDDCDDDSHAHGGHGGHGGGHGEGHGGGHSGGHGHGFRHDTGIGSFVCELVGKPIDMDKFNEFMHNLLEDSEKLYRYKGILAFRDPHSGEVLQRVLQGVHDMTEMSDPDPWPKDQEVKSQLVLIGRGLDRPRFLKAFREL